MDENRIGPTGRDDAQAARPVAFTRGGLLHGMRRGIPLGLTSVIFGLVFGVLSRQAGLTIAQACLMSGVVNAGSSQLVALSMWATPVPILPIVATTLLINMRLVLLAITLRPWYARLPAPAAYGTYFFLTDGAWALAFVELQKGSPDGAFMLGVGIVMYICWIGATAIGRITGAAIHDPSSWGLDFAIVAVFVALLVPLARHKGTSIILPWGLAACVAVATHELLPGNWYVLLGAVGGVLPAMRGRTRV